MLANALYVDALGAGSYVHGRHQGHHSVMGYAGSQTVPGQTTEDGA